MYSIGLIHAARQRTISAELGAVSRASAMGQNLRSEAYDVLLFGFGSGYYTVAAQPSW